MKIGLALSGGGARGIAHLGVVKALKEEGLTIVAYSGTSAGAIASAFMANNYSPEEALKVLDKTNLMRLIWPAFSKKGLLSISKTRKIYERYFPEDKFDSSKAELFITASNLQTGKPEVFNSGSLSLALMASCCIPILFDPVRIGDYSYVDGGILNNMPSEILKEHCDYVIGVNVAPILEDYAIKGPKQLIERVSMLAINGNVRSSREYCDLYFEPRELRNYGTFDFKKSREIFEHGYEYAKHHLSLIDKDDILHASIS